MAAKEQTETVMGYTIKRPRPTGWGWARLLQYIVLPFLGAMLALDLIFYLIFKYAFDSCYGVLCLIN